MFTIISQNTTEANVEHMVIDLCNDPQHIDSSFSVIIRADLDAGQQATYDDFITLLGTNTFFEILNGPCRFAADRASSSPVTESTEGSLDYATASAADKAKIDAIVQLALDLKQ